ncbi:MAG: T9SS type A sorting domain-containing protein [Saprospiraceae bacterium]|nr:T9SS type A sorting domain-containing protein [Saprospiraceae bacterium]MCF8249951.1 T9SS type A sorting domain-containing protein [Saprospiraceae bacterium]MCF8279364.1 T9SS type A sorting domain-containing protein [Bacteroidales bacterium]MCF8310055.1 T9SS type A sorting domain-containing protein [Saprospiraceae bacterium]MCF8438955.1 T9SS type A sorting domain-containing protein [Saprospiraceae bacterium]
MKKINFYMAGILFLLCQNLDAQCIKNVQNLINMPAPCFFVGYVDFDNSECFDVANGSNWVYTWKIRSADDGQIIASYDGLAFQHTFKKFGGYQFCLEVDKDGNPTNTPDIVDCVTYTTCEICTGDSIKIVYNSCPYGEGCDITFTTYIEAQNDIGLKSIAKAIITYLPTPQELLGGVDSYDIEFGDIPVEYNPFNDTIQISQSFKIPFKRGCFKPRIVFQLEDGFGAHGQDDMACSELELRSEDKFRCIACANENGDCIASEVAARISNEEDSCDPFYFCNQLRSSESDKVSEQQHTTLLVSPNPANDRLHLEFPNTQDDFRRLIILNQFGQKLIQREFSNDETSTDIMVSDLVPGLYFAKMMIENGETLKSAQILIQR